MISCRDRWPWTKPGYFAMTRWQSNNQWIGGIEAHPAPQNSYCKNPLENFLPRFFGVKTASSSLIIFQRVKLITRSVTHLCWCNWRTFWRKTKREVHKGCLVPARQYPGSPGTCNPEETLYLGFQYLDHPPYSPDLVPPDYHLFPGLKNNWKVAIFRPTWRSLLPRRPGWTDNLLNFFFEWLAKVEQRTKKCIELLGEYVE